MARIRTIKPEFWQDEDLALLDAEVRLLAIGLLNHADDEGYFKAHPALVKAVVFPFTEDSLNIHGMLKQLEKVGYLRLFEGQNGKQYGVINGFVKHQKVNRPSPSKIKEFERFTENSLNIQGELTAGKEQGTGNREHEYKQTPGGDYVFTGQTFNINQKDYANHKKIYPRLDLLAEYQQLDVELRDESKKSLWHTLNKKLNYRNKNAAPQTSKFALDGIAYESGDL